MATNNQIKFFKGKNAPATPIAGMIWFCTADRTIRVYTGSEWEKYAGLVDAAWNGTERKLTITSAAGSTTTLDLSDCASASDLATKLQTINNTLSTHDSRITAAQNAANAAANAAAVADGKAVQEAADRASEITRVEGLISAEAATARAAEKTNKEAAAAAAALGQQGIDAAAAASKAVETEKGRAEGIEKDLDDRLKVVEGAVGQGGSVESQINTKIESLDADVTSAEGTKVRVQVVESDGKITAVNVTESDIASAQALADEIANREADDAAIGARIDSLASAGDADGNGKGRVTILEEQVRALNAATHFEGKVEGETFEDAIDASDKTFDPGDIVIYGNKEYIFDGTNWIELGDTTAEQSRISALENLVGLTSVDSQIDAKINALDATVGSTTVANGKHVAVEVVEVDGKLTAVNVAENDIASAAHLSEVEGEVDLNTQAVADHKARIEALEGTANALAGTYVSKTDYATDKQAFEKAHTDLQGEIDAAEGRLDTAEADIDELQSDVANLQAAIGVADEATAPNYSGSNYLSDAATMVAADKALDAKIKEVADSVTNKNVTAQGDAYVSATAADNKVTITTVTGTVESKSGLATNQGVYDALCWVEFE
jgi:hypothetical protein